MKKHKSTSLFSILVKTCIFVFAIAFSTCAFSLNSYAVGSFSVPNTTNTSTFDIDIYGGCIFNVYTLTQGTSSDSDDVDVLLGGNSVSGTQNKSDLYNCGYRYTNSRFDYYQHSIAQHRVLTYTAGSITSDTYALVSGSTNIIGNYNANFANYDFDIYNSIEAMYVKYETSSSTSSFTLPTVSATAYAEFMYAFDMPVTSAHTGTSFVLDSTSISASHAPVGQSTALAYINDSIVSWCTVLDGTNSNDTPEALGFSVSELFNYDHVTPTGYTSCFIIGYIPLYEDGYLEFNNKTLKFKALDASGYSDMYTTDGKNLAYYGYVWPSMFRSPTYKQMGARYDDSFKYINPYFKIQWPTSEDEYEAFITRYFSAYSFTDNQRDGSSLEQNNDLPSDSSVIGWWSVFNFAGAVVFPFQNLINLFTDVSSTHCVSIPVISSMLGIPSDQQAQYCSWFPPSVINILTPVISIFSMIVLFGFIINWLSERQSTTTLFASASRSAKK